MVIGGVLGGISSLSEEARADAWSIEFADSAGFVGGFTSMALDNNGYAHFRLNFFYNYI